MTTTIQRTRTADEAILNFCAATGSHIDDALTDLLCDLMHWATDHNEDFEAALTQAERHFQAEVPR